MCDAVKKVKYNSKIIFIDSCIVDDIKKLWEQGIKTVGSCCGHGKINPTVIIDTKEDEKQMIELGYSRSEWPLYKNKWYVFKLKNTNL